MRKITLFVTALLTAVVALSKESDKPKQISLSSEEQELVVQNNDFAFNLFRQARGEKSSVMSPLSITYALGMLNNAAQGKTQQEINAVLGGTTPAEGGELLSVDVINQFCRKLLTACGQLDVNTNVGIANNIYFNAILGLNMNTAFLKAAQSFYDAEPQMRDLYDPKTLAEINQWTSNHTEGLIPEILSENDLLPNLVSILVNALYFKGPWTHPFEKASTIPVEFDNGRATVNMMNQTEDFAYAEDNLYQSVILPYGNGAYQMTVFLPKRGKKLSDMLAALDGKSLNSSAYKKCRVALGLPRIDTETSLDLKDVMMELGMPNAFLDYEDAEGFTEFCHWGDDETDSERLWIGLMKQKAKLKLDEEGTEAAAVTVIEMVNKSAPSDNLVTFFADRPFVYTISERSTGAILFIGQYMGDPIKNQRHNIQLTADERALVRHNNDFAFELFRKANNGGDLILSPLSITYALGMANNGADGQTRQEINNVLLGGGGDASQLNDKGEMINEFCRKLLTEAPLLDEETRVSIANTAYVNNHWGYELQPAFVQKANDYYDAQPETRDFYDGQTRDVINQWASDHTEGMIKEVLSEQSFNPDAVSYLLNAIYFKGKWESEFDVENTQDEPFNGGADVPMMHQYGDFLYSEDDLCQTVSLPYGNGAYKMTVFLPCKGKTVSDVLAQMNGDNWQRRNFSSYSVDLKLPRFETETNQDLKGIMSALGMPSAFDKDLADFSHFCNVPTYIGMMKQVAKIKLDEKGTEAAAVTIIGYETTSIEEPKEAVFHANHPFLYVISEISTGVIFFIGQYAGAEGSRIPDGISDASYLNDRGEMTNDRRSGVYDLQGRLVETSNFNRQSSKLPKGLYIQSGRKILK